MDRYVKFLQITPKVYKNLAHKDQDTLYFVYEKDENTSKLYLGTKLIVGTEENDIIHTLSDLQDILLDENIDTDSVLVYDIGENSWVNKSLSDLIFVGPTNETMGLCGLVPAPPKNQFNLFLRSDGSWANLGEIQNAQSNVLLLENLNKISHLDLIYQHTKDLNNNIGDIVIIKELITDNNWSYTGYVFKNNNWIAMTGNYNANNIYFEEDMITTTPIGNIDMINGIGHIPSKGKNLEEVFKAIFVKEEDSIVTYPSVNIDLNIDTSLYEVGTIIKPEYKIIFNKGKYSYGPDTNIHVLKWEIKDSNGNIFYNNSNTYDDITINDDTLYSIEAKAYYSEGAIPFTNLNNQCVNKQIKTGVTTATVSKSLQGYRKCFFGTVFEKNEITSSTIRELDSTNNKITNGTSITIPIPLGAYRVIFAYPAYLEDIVSIVDKNGLNANILSSFTQTLIKVYGKNNYNAINYKVYYLDYAKENDILNSYTFTIGEEA